MLRATRLCPRSRRGRCFGELIPKSIRRGEVFMGEPANKPADDVPVTSSVPLRLPEEQEALFRQVLTLFEKERLPYAVSGAFALQQHTGICRFTKDLDVFLTPQDMSAALKHLREHGFECEIYDPVWLAKAHRDDYFVDLITGMSNAVITVDPSWIERAHPATMVGVKTKVLAPEELLASKLFVTRRERFDGADIAHVIYGTRGKIDWARVLRLAGENWEMLLWSLLLFRYVYPAQTHYVPASIWRDLLRRLDREVSRPDPQAKFRGSLVDDNMFAIDLDEWRLDNVQEETRQIRLKQMKALRKCACKSAGTAARRAS